MLRAVAQDELQQEQPDLVAAERPQGAGIVRGEQPDPVAVRVRAKHELGFYRDCQFGGEEQGVGIFRIRHADGAEKGIRPGLLGDGLDLPATGAIQDFRYKTRSAAMQGRINNLQVGEPIRVVGIDAVGQEIGIVSLIDLCTKRI